MVNNTNPKETIDMKCNIEGCPGEYEERKIVHTVRHKGQVIVIDHLPAEVCSVCGDVLLKPETVRRIESLLRTEAHPTSTVPLNEYA
jgi:YgiT-type zinc finger domain-containing protein